MPRYDALVFVAVAWAMLRLLRGVRAFPWLAGACVLLALGVVVHQWTTGHEGRTAIVLGIYPYSDAGEYYADTQRLLAGVPFDYAGRRPLHGAVTAAMLRATGDDLRIVLVLQAIGLGLSTAFATSEARRAAGERAALAVLVIGCFFQRRFAGFVATEALGYPLGALAFGFLVRAATNEGRDRIVAVFCGALALSLGLLARPGPMLVVPAIAAWTALRGTRRERIDGAAAAIAGGALAMAINALLAREVSSGTAFVDLPPILYGAMHREDYRRIFIDHPELASLAEGARFDAMMRIVASDARAHPGLVVTGIAASLSSFLGAPTGLFSFVWNTPDDHVFEGDASPARWARELGVYGVVNIVAMGALGLLFVVSFVAGLVRVWRTRSEPIASLALAVAIGALASTPFMPPWITQSVQVDSAVLPFVALLSSLAFRSEPADEAAPSARGPVIVLVTGTAAAIAGIGWVVARPDRAPTKMCEPRAVVARADPSTRILVGDASMATLARNVFFLRRHNESLVAALEREVHPGRAMVLVYDACASTVRLAIGDDDVVPRDRAWRRYESRATDDAYVVVLTRAW